MLWKTTLKERILSSRIKTHQIKTKVIMVYFDYNAKFSGCSYSDKITKLEKVFHCSFLSGSVG
jgi:hypothetical protein